MALESDQGCCKLGSARGVAPRNTSFFTFFGGFAAKKREEETWGRRSRPQSPTGKDVATALERDRYGTRKSIKCAIIRGEIATVPPNSLHPEQEHDLTSDPQPLHPPRDQLVS